jgi:hypothetical protein
MAIHVGWGNPEQTAIHLEFERGWKWDDLYAAIQAADDLIISVPHKVDLIIDIRKAGGIPHDFMNVAGDVFASGDARDNEGQKIVVGAGWLIQTAYGTFLKVYGSHLKNRPFLFASSMDEAQTMLNGA